MRKPNLACSVAALACALALAAPPAFADRQEAALGSDGTLYTARTGLYGDLFPGGTHANPHNPVLALDVLGPDGSAQRLLVPQTGGAEVESLPSVLFEDDSSTVFLVWMTEVGQTTWMVNLASYDGTNWSGPFGIPGNPFAAKTAPQMAMTRDLFDETDSTGATVTRHRTIVHVLWAEAVNSVSSQFAAMYVPVILQDGEYVGWNPLQHLFDFDPGPTPQTLTAAKAAAAASGTSPLVASPTIEAGRDDRTVVVGFADGVSGLLDTVEIDVLPRQLGYLSDKVRGAIIDIGARLSYPSNRQQMADEVNAAVLQAGSAFYPAVLTPIADQISNTILDSNALALPALADQCRQIAIDTGAKYSQRGLRPASDASYGSLTRVIDLNVASQGGVAITGVPTHLLQVRVASSRPIPQVGSNNLQLYLSRTGEDAIVAWANDDGSAISYRTTQGNSWSALRSLPLSSSLDQPHAFLVLEQRVRH